MIPWWITTASFVLWSAVTLARFLVERNKLLLSILFFQAWTVLSYLLNQFGVIGDDDRVAALRLTITGLAVAYSCFSLSMLIPEYLLWKRKRRP